MYNHGPNSKRKDTQYPEIKPGSIITTLYPRENLEVQRKALSSKAISNLKQVTKLTKPTVKRQ